MSLITIHGGGEQSHERVLRELNSGNEWPDYRGNSLRGKWFLSDDSYVNEKFVRNWHWNPFAGDWIWRPAFVMVANYDYVTEMDVE